MFYKFIKTYDDLIELIIKDKQISIVPTNKKSFFIAKYENFIILFSVLKKIYTVLAVSEHTTLLSAMLIRSNIDLKNIEFILDKANFIRYFAYQRIPYELNCRTVNKDKLFINKSFPEIWGSSIIFNKM